MDNVQKFPVAVHEWGKHELLHVFSGPSESEELPI